MLILNAAQYDTWLSSDHQSEEARALGSSHAEMRVIRLDLANARLWRGHREAFLAPRAFDLLVLFVRNTDRLLTKNAILEALWPERYVTEGLVKSYVRDLRKALGDDPKVPCYIRTVHRRGYRFIGRIVVNADERYLLSAPPHG